MIQKYRNQALAHLLSILPGFVALVMIVRALKGGDAKVSTALSMLGIIALIGVYLRGCYLIVKAKGQNSAALAIAVPFMCFGGIAPLIVAIALKDNYPRQGSSRRARFGDSEEGQRHVSRLERRVRYKRNALLSLYFGWPIMFVGAALGYYRWGIFEDHSKELGLGMLVLLAGYGVVMAGCGWWLKAKRWDQALLIVGLLPLLGLLIPFVRVALFRIPELLWGGVLFMPIVLMVVILTLPDRS